MEEMTPHNWTDVKKIKFHHRVKRFYYKNLFRKIYTVAIIGLIGANIFSIMKYSSFADEYDNLQPANQDSEWLDTESLQNADIEYTDVADNTKYIMSKNLGATSANINSEQSYGYYYQWGNDYPYSGYDSENCEWDDDEGGYFCPLSGYVEPAEESLGVQSIDDSNPAPSDYDRFSDYGDFIGDGDGYRWDEGAQGPCPEGYHVPTLTEWGNLFLQWCEDSDVCDTRKLESNGGGFYYLPTFDDLNSRSLGNGDGQSNVEVLNAFMQKYKLPFAGGRDKDYVSFIGENGLYWSSTFLYGDSWSFYMDPDGNTQLYDGNGYYGLSVRCISGEYNEAEDPMPLAVDLYLGGREDPHVSRSISSFNVDNNGMMGRIFIPADQPIPASKIAKLENSGYKRYYVDDDRNSSFKVKLYDWENEGISLDEYMSLVSQYNNHGNGTLELYGFPRCDDDEQYVNGECVPVKWGTTINDQGSYECLAEGATYDTDLGQCVYTAKSVDGSIIKLMSSNLGATEDNEMGDFYQWGRDQRFGRGGCNSSSCNVDYDNDYYDFGNYEYWYEEDLDGESLETSSLTAPYKREEGDKGPCPKGFHVPTATEWTNLLVQWCEDSDLCDTRDLKDTNGLYSNSNYWALSYNYPSHDVNSLSVSNLGNGEGTEIDKIIWEFMEDYNLSPGGIRNSNYVEMVGDWGYYWSSSRIANNRAWFLAVSNNYGGLDWYYRMYGYSVRCFADTSTTPEPIAVHLWLYEDEEDAQSLNISSIDDYPDEYLGRIFVASGAGLTDEKKVELSQYEWSIYDGNGLSGININDVVFTSDDFINDEYPAITLVGIPKGECNPGEEWDSSLNNGEGGCRISCLGKGAKYDTGTQQCVYIAHDLDGKEIKIMDRNLGASKDNPMGDFFQWGNDYMYPRYPQTAINAGNCDALKPGNNGNGYCPLEQIQVIEEQPSMSLQGINNDWLVDYDRFYNYWKMDGNGNCFPVDEYGNCIPQDEYNWSAGAQGPCDEGYHVPTIDEWQNIFISRCEENDECDTREMLPYGNLDYYLEQKECLENGYDYCDYDNIEDLEYYKNRIIENGMEYKWFLDDNYGNGKYIISSFMEDYNFSLAGNRSVDYVGNVGDWGYYWSSTSIYDGGAREFYLGPSYGVGANDDSRDDALSVRCIANEKRSSTPIALDLFLGGDDTDDDTYFGNLDWVGRKFVSSGSSVDVDKLTAATLDSPKLDKNHLVWYLVNEQDESQRITSETKFTENTRVYAFVEETDEPDPQDDPDPSSGGNNGSSSGNSGSSSGNNGSSSGNNGSSSGGNGSSNGGSSSGGSSSSSTGKKVTKITDTHEVAEETNNQKSESDTQASASQGNVSQNSGDLDLEQYNATYTSEQNRAYQFAKAHGITTTPTIREAKMNTPLTRIEMAKMLSYYAVNVLGMVPQHGAGVANFKDVPEKLDAQYDNGVSLAYQLGIMGINMPNNKFRPNDKVTRAEFATALSRMLYGMEDGTGKLKYYEPHIARLYNEGIINNTNPKMEELRGYVMIMLMRTSK